MNEEENFNYPPGPHCVVTGSVISGVQIHGPFDSVEKAIKWAETKTTVLGLCSIAPLQKPQL